MGTRECRVFCISLPSLERIAYMYSRCCMYLGIYDLKLFLLSEGLQLTTHPHTINVSILRKSKPSFRKPMNISSPKPHDVQSTRNRGCNCGDLIAVHGGGGENTALGSCAG